MLKKIMQYMYFYFVLIFKYSFKNIVNKFYGSISVYFNEAAMSRHNILAKVVKAARFVMNIQ